MGPEVQIVVDGLHARHAVRHGKRLLNLLLRIHVPGQLHDTTDTLRRSSATISAPDPRRLPALPGRQARRHRWRGCPAPSRSSWRCWSRGPSTCSRRRTRTRTTRAPRRSTTGFRCKARVAHVGSENPDLCLKHESCHKVNFSDVTGLPRRCSVFPVNRCLR